MPLGKTLPPGAAQPNRGDQPDAAREFFRLMRAPANQPVTHDRYEAAMRHAETMRHFSISLGRFVDAPKKALYSAASPQAAIGTWQSLGPGNVGGRTNALVIHPTQPNTMYAGAADGGVWKTTDGGATWIPLTDLSPNIAIGSLVMDPDNPLVVYAGTGEGAANIDAVRGMGILKTSDGGATWTRLSATNTSDFYYVNKLVFGPPHAPAARNLYAATQNGVFRSSDGGATWIRSFNTQDCLDMAARTNTGATDTVFATCAANGFGGNAAPVAIYRNTDAAGAGAWTQVYTVPNMSRTSLAIAPSQQSTVYAMAWTQVKPTNASGLAGVFRSTANGDSGSWTTQTSNASTTRLNTVMLDNTREAFADVCSGGTASFGFGQGWYDNVLAVDPVNPNIVWAGGIDTFRSDDGGVNWGIASYWNRSGAPGYAHSDQHGVVFKPGYDGASNQTVYIVNDGGMFRSDNGRAATQTGDTAECAPNPKILWTSLNNGYTVTQFYHGLPYPGSAFYFGGAQDNGSVRSTGNLAAPWTPVSTGDGGWVALDPNNPNTIYTEYTNRTTYRSNDGGVNNNQATNGITDTNDNFLFIKQITQDRNNAKLLYVGGSMLWRTLDGGDNWTAASALVNNKITAIAIAPSDSNTVYFGDLNGNVYNNSSALAANATTTWQFTTPRPSPVSAIAVNPTIPKLVYAVYSGFLQTASDHHVYASPDGGASWTSLDGSGATGIPDVPVNAILIDPVHTLNIYLGTDLGIYVSADGGITWSRDANPFANAGIGSLSFERGSGVTYLYAFTHGRSAWRAQLPNSGTPCTYALDKTSLLYPAAGGAQSVTVTTGANCVYSAIPSALGMAEIANPATGTGTGPVFVGMFGLNEGGAPATDKVLIQGQTVLVTQAAAPHFNLATLKNDETATAAPTALPFAALVDPGYTTAATDPVHTCTQSADTGSSWWKAVSPGAGQLQLEQVNGAVLSAYPLLATGLPGAEVTGSCLDGTGAGRSTIQFNVTAGTTYLIEVSSRATATTFFGLGITFIPNTYITVTTPKSTLAPGESVQASTTIAGPENQGIRWSIAPEIGAISPTGLYTAPPTLAGSAQVVITASSFLDDGDFGSTTVYVNGAPAGSMNVPAAGVVNAATNQAGGVAPGELVTIYGSGFGPAQLTTLTLGVNGNVATTLANTQVLFDGVPAPMVYAANGQVSAVAPFGIANQPMTAVQIKSGGSTSAPALLPVTTAAPGIFTANSSGAGPAAVLNQDGSLNGPQNPAPTGTTIVFYATGGGAMKPAQTDGTVSTALNSTALSATVTIGGISSKVAYLGAAPNFVAGVLQANVTIPPASASGAAPIVLTIGGVPSPATVTVYVQ